MQIKKVVVGNLGENCYVIIKNNTCLIVDPGDEADKIKKVVGNMEVLSILITHYHFDHVGALEEISKYYKTSVVDYKSNKMQNIGPFNFEIISTKGHKEDAASFYFSKENVMFVGDFIFKGTIGRCDLPGGNFNEMEKSLTKIKTYDKKIKLYPGHGDDTTLEEELKYNSYLF